MGEILTRVTVWAALSGYALGVATILMSRRRSGWLRPARWLWTGGCVAFLAHVFCAFTYYYGWSHATAFRETARQTQETIGPAWGGGLFVSYVFTLAWALDALWWWVGGLESYHRRPRLLMAAWHGFFLFIVFNGTVVFETGPARWFGLLICSGIVSLWLATSIRKYAHS